MNWYLKVLKQYADFKGRARRKEYWMFTLFSTIISIAILFIGKIIDPQSSYQNPSILSNIYSIALFLPSLAVAVRRLHDIDKSGWYLLLIFLPLIGWIWLIVLLCKNGDEGTNEYGPDPKNPTDELEEIGTAEV